MGTSKLYNKSPYVYTRSGYRRPGVITKRIKVNDNQEDPAEQDRKNRKETANKIIEYVNKGMTLDEAISEVLKDKEVQKKFAYLTKHGIDLKPLMKGWYESFRFKRDESSLER